MGLKRISTLRQVVIDDSEASVSLSLRDGANRERTGLQLKEELSRQLPAPSTPIFIHKNRNGTIAVATGVEPEVWPEDQR